MRIAWKLFKLKILFGCPDWHPNTKKTYHTFTEKKSAYRTISYMEWILSYKKCISYFSLKENCLWYHFTSYMECMKKCLSYIFHKKLCDKLFLQCCIQKKQSNFLEFLFHKFQLQNHFQARISIFWEEKIICKKIYFCL